MYKPYVYPLQVLLSIAFVTYFSVSSVKIIWVLQVGMKCIITLPIKIKGNLKITVCPLTKELQT